MSQQPPLQTKIKLNLKRRASDISDAIPGGDSSASTPLLSGNSTPPEGGIMTSSSSMVSLGPDGIPKVKKIKISIGGKPASEVVPNEMDAWASVKDKSVINENSLKLLKTLKDFKQGARFLADPFLELVDRIEYPDYFQLIKKPISFVEIEEKIKSSRYSSMNEFKRDILLCFSNCKTYNQPNSGIYMDANTLEKLFLDHYQSGPNGKKRGARLSLSAPKTPSVTAPSTAAVTSMSEKKKVVAPKVRLPAGMIVPKPRPTDPFLLLFDCLERSDYKTFQDTFDSVVTGPSICNKLMAVNLFDHDFTWTLLHAACYYGSLKATEMLIERGANVEIEDTWYRGRPFAWATFGGHPKLCRILMDKYKVEKEAKNIHGQTAYDLISDKNLPHWKALFSPDRKPQVFPVNPPPKPVAAKPIAAIPTSLPARRATTYSNPVGVTPVSAAKPSPALQNFMVPSVSRHGHALVTPSGATLGKAYPKRGQMPVQADVKKPPVASIIQPIPKAAIMPTEYQNYMEQRREIQTDVALISKMTVSAEDGSFFLTIPVSPSDPEYGFHGSFVALPETLKTVKIHVELTQQPFPDPTGDGFNTLYTVSGHHGHSLNSRSPDGQVFFQQVSVPIGIEGKGDLNQVHDFEVKLGGSLNSIELAVTATSWGEAEVVFGVHQTYCLLLTAGNQ